MAFYVESRMLGPNGEPGPKARICVATQARAEQLAAQKPGATWREVAHEDLTDKERAGLALAR